MSLSDYINEKPVLCTSRLTLRALRPEDAEAMRRWTTNKNIYKYWGKSMGKGDKDPELLFLKPELPTKSFHWGIVQNTDNIVIGELWVYNIENNRMAQVAVRLAEELHGLGYGTEALREAVRFCFENTQLRRLWTGVDIRNSPSCRVLKNCGFTREGLIRQGKMCSCWCDHYIYGLLREDYEKTKGQ